MTGKHAAALAVVCVALMLFAPCAAAYGGANAGGNYTYSQEGKAVSIPGTYEYTGAMVLSDGDGIAAANPQDIFVANDGEIYVADTDNDRIIMYSGDRKFLGMISEIHHKDGTVSNLNRPEGIFVTADGMMLIADTQNNRIVRCGKDGKADAVIYKPEGMSGVDEDALFYPIKVACDSLGRIDVIAKNINFGIVQLDQSGVFLSYIGAPSVQPDLFTLIWRRFSTKAQKQQLLRFVATEYSNIYVDERDFIWGTISTLDEDALADAVTSRDKTGSVTPIRRLNSVGNDILKRNGFHSPLGDLSVQYKPSKIIDLAVGPSGIYSMLDIERGRVFTYDDNGNLLYVFGGFGNRSDSFQNPCALSYMGESVMVLDSALGEIKIFDPTPYGTLVLDAIERQYGGDFAEANELWTQIAAQNTNFSYAYVGMGNAYLSEKKYEDALRCYEFANAPKEYSEAFALLRRERLNTYFPYIFGFVIALAVILTIWRLTVRFLRYKKRLMGGEGR